MADKTPAATPQEREISVDLSAADPAKAVTRRDGKDIARSVREAAEQDAPPTRSKAEREMFKRMRKLEQNLERQFDQRLANKEAEWQRERSDLTQRLDKLSLDQGGSDDKADAAHESAIAALRAKLEASYEKGDSKESAELTLQISKLDAQFWAKKAHAAGVTTRETAATTERAAGGQQQQKPAPANKGPTRAGARFISANDDWWDDPDFAVEQSATNTIYLGLLEEGFDAKSEETYKEVARRLKAKFPKLPVQAGRRDPDEEDDADDEDAHDGDRPGETRPRRGAPAARLEDRGGGSSRPRERSTSRTLTPEEIATMKACRLDPDNDRDVVQFLREAVALEASQA